MKALTRWGLVFWILAPMSIGCFAQSGIITTYAGNGTADFSGDGGPATLAQLNLPFGVAVNSSDRLYIADQFNSIIRKVTFTGASDLFFPQVGPASTVISGGRR